MNTTPPQDGDLPDIDTARSFNRKMADRAAEKKIRELEAGQRPKPVIRSGTWLNAQTFAPIAWAVPGWFPEGMTFLGGGPKSGKSWLSQSIGLSIASGSLVLGSLGSPRDQPARPVMYFALEDSDRRIKARSAELGWHQVPELFCYTTKAAPDQVLSELRRFLEECARWRPVAVIDTWGKIMSPAARGETTYDRDYRLGSQVKQCVDDVPGSSVIINHHTRKESAADFIDMLSGTFGVAGSADTIAILSRKRGELSGKIQVTGRDVEEGTYALAGFPSWRLDGVSLAEAATRAEASRARENLGDRSTQILNMIDARGEILTAEVALALGVSADTASTYLGRLAKSGKIQSTGRGKWGVGSVGSVGSVGNQDGDQASLVPPVGSVGSVGSQIPSSQQPTEQTGDTRRRGREWFLNPDGSENWAAMWERADHTA